MSFDLDGNSLMVAGPKPVHKMIEDIGLFIKHICIEVIHEIQNPLLPNRFADYGKRIYLTGGKVIYDFIKPDNIINVINKDINLLSHDIDLKLILKDDVDIDDERYKRTLINDIYMAFYNVIIKENTYIDFIAYYIGQYFRFRGFIFGGDNPDDPGFFFKLNPTDYGTDEEKIEVIKKIIKVETMPTFNRLGTVTKVSFKIYKTNGEERYLTFMDILNVKEAETETEYDLLRGNERFATHKYTEYYTRAGLKVIHIDYNNIYETIAKANELGNRHDACYFQPAAIYYKHHKNAVKHQYYLDSIRNDNIESYTRLDDLNHEKDLLNKEAIKSCKPHFDPLAVVQATPTESLDGTLVLDNDLDTSFRNVTTNIFLDDDKFGDTLINANGVERSIIYGYSINSILPTAGLIKYINTRDNRYLNQTVRGFKTLDGVDLTIGMYYHKLVEVFHKLYDNPIWNTMEPNIPNESFYVYRGMNCMSWINNIGQVFPKNLEDFRPGYRIKVPLFFSTSINPSLALGFSKSHSDIGVFFKLRIQDPKNTRCIYMNNGDLTEYPHEKEILFPPYTELKITNVSYKRRQQFRPNTGISLILFLEADIKVPDADFIDIVKINILQPEDIVPAPANAPINTSAAGPAPEPAPGLYYDEPGKDVDKPVIDYDYNEMMARLPYDIKDKINYQPDKKVAKEAIETDLKNIELATNIKKKIESNPNILESLFENPKYFDKTEHNKYMKHMSERDIFDMGMFLELVGPSKEDEKEDEKEQENGGPQPISREDREDGSNNKSFSMKGTLGGGALSRKKTAKGTFRKSTNKTKRRNKSIRKTKKSKKKSVARKRVTKRNNKKSKK